VSRVLIIEDEPALADSVRYGLEREGYECTVLADGSRAVDFARSWRPDLILLDLMLPGMPGTDVCREIRAISRVPIVMVTAKDTEADKVIGLELGADDYITKPFSMRELIARVRAVMRRTGVAESVEPSTALDGGPVHMDTERHEVRVHGSVVDLPPKEFSLLESLMRRSGKLMTRESLISQVWGDDYYGDTRTLDVHIKRLRGKIETDPGNPKHLITVRGLGYRFEP
jgi:two-component system response regulator RegX3